MKVVILAGGLGTRLREETEFKPKPLVEIGGKPIIWHLIKYYEQAGVREFIVCAGYKGEMLIDYFAKEKDLKHLGVQVVQTGEFTNTGERIRLIEEFVERESFYCTYGDGLANINLNEVLLSHKSMNKIGTLCSTRPVSRFGVLELDANNQVKYFREKPIMNSWVNIGFFIFKGEIFDHIKTNVSLETEVLTKLAGLNELNAFKHEGFWQPMDTYREALILNELWTSGEAPWKIW